jgi:hypothetical protein
VSLIHNNYLTAVYSRVSALLVYAPEYVKGWVKEAMLKHPFRRKEFRYYFLAIITAQGSSEIKTVRGKLLAAHIEFEDLRHREFDLENLVKDPCGLWFLRNKNGIETVGPSAATPMALVSSAPRTSTRSRT